MSQSPAPGRIGKYEILRTLGKGAMGVVYLAHDTVLERDVALKVMVPQIVGDAALRARFEREAKAVARLAHPNVVGIFDLGTHVDGSPYIAMERLEGRDLQKAMRSSPPMTLDQKLTVIAEVLAGLAHAHAAGIVHRDIKPANIFLTDDGKVKIMDFGVARLSNVSMTGTGNIVGTADYMSPEQVQGAKVDGRSDIFSVGCMLYELVVGQPPFRADNLMAIFYKITHEDPSFAGLPAGEEYARLLPILKRALAKPLEARYQTAAELAADLGRHLERPPVVEATHPGAAYDGATTLASSATVADESAKPSRGGFPRYLSLGAAILTAAAVFIYVTDQRWPRVTDARTPPTPTTVVPPVADDKTPSPTATPGPSATATPPPVTATPNTNGDTRKRVAALLLRAANALSEQRYKEAKALYERVIHIEPGNEDALRGLQVSAERIADASRSLQTPAPPRRVFVTRHARPMSPETAAPDLDKNWKVEGVPVRSGSQPTDLPGKIAFDVIPAFPQPNRTYSVVVTFHNPGSAPIEIQSVWITTEINGAKAGHPVTSQVRVVAPQQDAMMLRIEGNPWREDTGTWSMEAKVTTARREIYAATLVWE